MIMGKLKENFYNWLGMKIYTSSETFRNTIYGIYYSDVMIPKLDKIKGLENELLKLKTETNVLKMNELVKFKSPELVEAQQEVKPRKKRKYTKRKKEVTE